MSTHDLRRRVQRFTDLRRRHAAHEKLSDEDMMELNKGIPAEEYREIILAIRGERRSATPAKKVKEKEAKQTKERAMVTPVDINSFLDEEHELPSPPKI